MLGFIRSRVVTKEFSIELEYEEIFVKKIRDFSIFVKTDDHLESEYPQKCKNFREISQF